MRCKAISCNGFFFPLSPSAKEREFMSWLKFSVWLATAALLAGLSSRMALSQEPPPDRDAAWDGPPGPGPDHQVARPDDERRAGPPRSREDGPPGPPDIAVDSRCLADPRAIAPSGGSRRVANSADKARHRVESLVLRGRRKWVANRGCVVGRGCATAATCVADPGAIGPGRHSLLAANSADKDRHRVESLVLRGRRKWVANRGCMVGRGCATAATCVADPKAIGPGRRSLLAAISADKDRHRVESLVLRGRRKWVANRGCMVGRGCATAARCVADPKAIGPGRNLLVANSADKDRHRAESLVLRGRRKWVAVPKLIGRSLHKVNAAAKVRHGKQPAMRTTLTQPNSWFCMR